MTTASNSSGAAGQYCQPDSTIQSESDAETPNEDECPLTLLLFSSLHTDGPLFDEADPVIGALQPV
jgi:hypothetical protein